MTPKNPLLALDSPIHDAYNSVSVLEIVVDNLTRCKHPLQRAHIDGYVALLITEQEMEAMNFALSSALNSARAAVDALDAAWDCAKSTAPTLQSKNSSPCVDMQKKTMQSMNQ